MWRTRIDRWALWIGALPSAPVIAVSYAVSITASLLIGKEQIAVVVVPVATAVAFYCCLRPARRFGTFGTWMMPGAVVAAVQWFVDVPGWTIGMPLSLVAIAIAMSDDRDDRRARAAVTP